ncbi:hypothetical protein ABTM68_20055, partial [Acinetobacter baumannii]
ELLDQNSARIEKEFGNDPETEIELLGVTAKIYRELDESAHAAALHKRYADLATAHYGRLHPLVVQSLLDDIDSANSRGDSVSALRLL